MQKGRLQTIFMTVAAALVALPVSAFSFSPPRQFIEVAAGKEQVFSFDIENETARAARVHADVRSFAPGANGTPIFTDTNLPTSIAPFVILSVNDFSMKPNEHRAYRFTVKVSKTAQPGSYYGAIHFSFAANDGGAGTLATTGPLIFLNVPGAEPGKLTITSAQFPKGTITSMPEAITITLRNDGATVQVPGGEVTVKNIFGTRIRSFSINPDGAALLPSEARSFQAGNMVLERDSFMSELANFALGPYTMEMKVRSNDAASLEMGPAKFWVLPWRTLSAAAMISIALAMLLGFLLPHHRRHV